MVRYIGFFLLLFFLLSATSEEEVLLLGYEFDGEFFCKNKEKVFKGVNDKDGASFYNAGVMYSKGFCVKKDLELAYHLFLNGANEGDIDSLFNVGLMVYMGYGVDMDVNKSSQIFNQLVKNNYQKAIDFLCGTYKESEFILTLPQLEITESYSCPSGE